MTTKKDPALSPPPVFPLVPDDLARAYADVALGYNKRLPEIEAKIDGLEGHFLAAHGLAAAALQQSRENALRIEDIAAAVKAKPKFSSGQMAAVSVPPPSPPIEIRARRTPTGSQWIVDGEELEKLKLKISEKEAEERGAKEALAQKEAQELLDNARRKERRDRILFAVAVLTPIVSAAVYSLGHFTWH